jgi:hypothetical protein
VFVHLLADVEIPREGWGDVLPEVRAFQYELSALRWHKGPSVRTGLDRRSWCTSMLSAKSSVAGNAM